MERAFDVARLGDISRAPAQAIDAEAIGGQVTTVHYNRLALPGNCSVRKVCGCARQAGATTAQVAILLFGAGASADT
jgi:hypothetical protein